MKKKAEQELMLMTEAETAVLKSTHETDERVPEDRRCTANTKY
jgi:hypothetical protein